MTKIDAFRHVAQVVNRSGSSFYWSMRLLPRNRRLGIYSVYAFCREVDDIADCDLPPSKKLEKLGEWREEINKVFSGVPKTLIGQALQSSAKAFRLNKNDFLSVIDGMEQDSALEVRIRNWESLEDYMDLVSCSVGRLSIPIFGIRGDENEKLAESLGQALQLTNILRDLFEDASNNRLYVPRDMIREQGIFSKIPSEVILHPEFKEIYKKIIKRAETLFERACSIISAGDRKNVVPTSLMLQNYWRVLKKLEKTNGPERGEHFNLSKFEIIWILVRYGILKWH